MDITIAAYCPEFNEHVGEATKERYDECLSLDIGTPCGQDIKALIDKAREVPIDPIVAGAFWTAILRSAGIMYFG